MKSQNVNVFERIIQNERLSIKWPFSNLYENNRIEMLFSFTF